MSEESRNMHEEPFPNFVLQGAFALVVCSLLLAGVARWTDVGTTRVPESQVIAVQALSFADRSDGAVVVRAAEGAETFSSASDSESDSESALVSQSGSSPIAVLEPGTNGFIRSVMRGLARERRANGVGPEAPFVLTRWADGRLSLDDAATGRRIELNAFGPTNADAFAVLMSPGPASAAPRS